MKVVVCVGTNCTMMGADSIITSLENLKDTLLQKEGTDPAFALEIEMARCLGECKKKNAVSPVVIVDGEMYRNASREQIMSVVLDAAYEYILPK